MQPLEFCHQQVQILGGFLFGLVLHILIQTDFLHDFLHDDLLHLLLLLHDLGTVAAALTAGVTEQLRAGWQLSLEYQFSFRTLASGISTFPKLNIPI